MTVVESWIVEDATMDKSNLYGLEAPKGAWVISMKVDDLDVWENECKSGNVRGFSIEGYFADSSKINHSQEHQAQSKINEVIEYLKNN